jgi:hypothetical protein
MPLPCITNVRLCLFVPQPRLSTQARTFSEPVLKRFMLDFRVHLPINADNESMCRGIADVYVASMMEQENKVSSPHHLDHRMTLTCIPSLLAIFRHLQRAMCSGETVPVFVLPKDTGMESDEEDEDGNRTVRPGACVNLLRAFVSIGCVATG